jgi:hypothetical protein
MKKLLKRVKKTERDCWEFQGCLLPNGYGKLGREGKTWLAHRYAYSQAVGPIPDGLHVMHRCDNRRCVNPEHLFVGSRVDNMQDMIAKGRHDFSGQRTGNWRESLFSVPETVRLEIVRLRVKERLSLKEVGKRCGVDAKYVSLLCSRTVSDYRRFRA